LGICVGMQILFDRSEESADSIHGLGIFSDPVVKLNSEVKPVPHMGWNSVTIVSSDFDFGLENNYFYFVHSFAIPYSCQKYSHSICSYGNQTFLASIHFNNIFATQFHPEKSGKEGLAVIFKFVNWVSGGEKPLPSLKRDESNFSDKSCKRIIACLDVRSNEDGCLIVTKGDQYDVLDEKSKSIRNFGSPVDLALKYYTSGIDEISFLSILSFQSFPLQDLPMLQLLQDTSDKVFVPLTIGGGIRSYTDEHGVFYTALSIADEYFRSGADKISIGSDAVYAALKFYRNGKDGNSSIELISQKYGSQAVVVSIDPKRVPVNCPSEANGYHVSEYKFKENGIEKSGLCWYQCTVKGGREVVNLDVIQLVKACDILGAGEYLVNCNFIILLQ
jgi:glutamine amidotransferase/cyclase